MRKKRNIFTILIMCLVFSFEAITAFAEPTTDEEIDDAKKKRDETQSELDEVNSSLEALSQEVGGVESEIDEVESALIQVMAEIDVLEENIKEKEIEIAETEKLYEAAILKEREQYEAMKIRIKYLYENGRTDLLQIYVEAGSITEALNRAEYIEELYAYDRRMLEEYQNTVNEVNALHNKLLTEKDELLAMKADYEEEKLEMEEIMEELQAIADDYYGQIAEAKAMANEYSKQIKQQNKEIKQLEEKKKREEEEARRKAEEERRRAEEEARRQSNDSMQQAQATNVVTTTNNNKYDVSAIYNSGGSDQGKSIAAFACQFIGNPYVPGGTSLTNGADCSGFVFSVYKSFGYTVPRTSLSLRSAGTEVAYENAQPGDVVCYPGHVAIYIGNGMIVHASTQKTGIKVSRADYRSILCVRRII